MTRPAGPLVIARVAVLALAAALATLAFAVAVPRAEGLASPPPGLTAISLDGKVGLSWQPSSGAAGYVVYRGLAPGSVTERISGQGPVTGTSFVDTTAASGTTYFYAVHALSDAGESGSGQLAKAGATTRSCSSGNPVVVENCFSGTSAWKTPDGPRAQSGGIQGFASASSVNAGGSVSVRVIANDAPYRIEIYRTGDYGGAGGRLISTVPGLAVTWPAGCYSEIETTGLLDCGTWPTAATVTTSPDWTSGVYLLKFVREDNGAASDIPLVVRNDSSHSDVLYHVPTSTYQAYNRFEGKSLYDDASSPPNTISGGRRAVKVSFDRPYSQPVSTADAHDWYTRTDVATVAWLERQGYDTTYVASEDIHAHGDQIARHSVFISGSHDEYWSQAMFDAAISARDAGTSLIFMGANAAYWRVRFEPAPVSGQPNRVLVAYKTIQGGPADPVSSTSTWRDPAGANRPENELIGQQYTGDNSNTSFPLRVSADQGRHRIWRHTDLADLAPGTTASVGSKIVGWEWDARQANGREPSGVTTLAASPVNGNLAQDNGRFYTTGPATAMTTIYRAASGALVFSTGTNNWWRGLGRNVHGDGEPNAVIAQAMANVLSDMDALPATPASELVLDSLDPPSVTGTTPPDGAVSVLPSAVLRVTFDRALDPASVDDSDFTIARAGGGPAVPVRATLDNRTRTVTVQPTDALEPFAAYTAQVGTGIRTWQGVAPAAPVTWSFGTGPGTPPVLTAKTPDSGATGVATDVAVRARFDTRLDPASVTTATISLRPASGGSAVPAQATYEASTRTAVLTPAARLAQATRYTATVGGTLRAEDGTQISAPVSWDFTTGTNLTVVDRTPAPFAFGVSPAAIVRVTFSRPVDAATVDGSGLKLTDANGQVVPAGVSYDAGARTATLTPAAPLVLMSSYGVTVGGAIRAADGGALDPVSWSFGTAASRPPAPAPTELLPTSGASGVANGARVLATFDTALDPGTVTPQTFTLTPSGGIPVAATVSYDAVAKRAVLTPSAALAPGRSYVATLGTQIRSTSGEPLAQAVSWGFTAAACPCQLMSGAVPAQTGLPVSDYRPGPGPFSYELGTKIVTDEPTRLLALRFYKSPGETGTHVGRVWTAGGAQVAQVTFANESSSGWQRQALGSPLDLTPGQTYVVSVGLNAYYSKAGSGLAAPLVSGPLRTVATGNGVFADRAGLFPSQTWQSTNYFVDAVVGLPTSQARTPQVVSTTPLDAATGVSPTPTVTARFSVALDPSTVNTQTFTLESQSGAAVPARAAYDEDRQSATLEPLAALERGTAYTARLLTGIRSDDETPLAAPVSVTFTTLGPDPPAVTSMSPVAGTTEVSPRDSVTATFSQPMDAATIPAGFTLEGPAGQPVQATASYDTVTRTASLTPALPLAPSTVYTARVSQATRSAAGLALNQPAAWTFVTSACPCKLYDDTPPSVSATGQSTQNWRSGSGPWSLELGVKIRVTQPASLEAIRFLKDARETGTHVGRVWSVGGALLASATFSGESGSGWQTGQLGTPLRLVPGQTYVVSVGYNAFFGVTPDGLRNERVSGPLRSIADGRNGVYGDASGIFPERTWAASDYFVDAVVR